MSDSQHQTPEQALAHAVGRNARMVLSVPASGMVRNFKSRFLGHSEQGVWVEVVSACAEVLLEDLIEGQRPLAASFARSNRRLSFTSVPIRIDQNYRINDHAVVTALLVAAPSSFQESQRRSTHRVSLEREEVRVRVWAIPEHAYINDRPSARSEIRVHLCDMSVGGIGVRLLGDSASRQFDADQRLRVEFKSGDVELLLDARLRLAPEQPNADTSAVGIVFQKLEDDLEGRRKLAAIDRIVANLHREEVRRARLGMAS